MGRTADPDSFSCRDDLAGHSHVPVPFYYLTLCNGASDINHWDRRHPRNRRDRRCRTERICQRIQVDYRGRNISSHHCVLEFVPELDQLPVQSVRAAPISPTAAAYTKWQDEPPQYAPGVHYRR